jgi:hypothetical protein
MTRTSFKPLLILLTAFFCIWSFAAQAQNTDSAYIVSGVDVDTLAESAVKARNKAFLEAQQKAFRMLAQRFSPAEDPEKIAIPDSRTLSGLVQDFEVTNEQLSRKRYKGTYTFRFREGAVQRYFGHAPVSSGAEQVANTGKAAVLVLPFYQMENGQTILWDAAKNPWMQAWRNKEGNSGVFVPLGDVSDVMDVKDDQALAYDLAAMNRLRARYGARDVLIVVARMSPDAPVPLELKIYRPKNGVSELEQTLSVPAGASSTQAELMSSAADLTERIIFSGRPQDVSQISEVEGPSVEVYDPQAEYVSPDGTQQSQPQPYTPAGGTARVHVRFAGVQDWMTIRRSLNDLPSLAAVRIVGLRPQDADMDLVYLDWGSLVSGLAGRGLSLIQTGEGSYELARRASGLVYTN